MRSFLRTLIFLFFIFLNNNLFSQTSTVIGETMTEEQKRVQYVRFELIDPKRVEFNKILIKINLSSTSVHKWNYSNFESKEKLNQHITKYQKIVNSINDNPKLFTLCNEINKLEQQININDNDNCDMVSRKLTQAIKNVSNAKAQINQLNGEEAKETSKELEHQNKILALDKGLLQAADKTNSLDKELLELNKTNIPQSLDDFLETKSNTSATNDFLANPKKENNVGGDFLAGSNEGNKDDFLSETNTINKDYQIENKNGLTGVVNSKGEILIPFKEWGIEEFKNGIAKISIRLDNIYVNAGDCIGFYSASIYKSGFVDNTGSFVDRYTITSNGRWQSAACLTLVRNDDDRSYEQIERDKEAYKRKKARKKRDAINEGKQMEINKIRDYK